MNTSSGEFDPATCGTPDFRWRRALADCPAWAPRPGPLVIVSPHPDDETLAAGGLAHAWARLGHGTVIISVTDGERAYPNWHGLELVRQRELSNAVQILGNGAIRTIRLELPDGRVSQHKMRLRKAIGDAARGDPTLICPYELDGHPDHEAAAEACLDVARGHGLPVARYPVWMWHRAQPGELAGLACGRFWLDSAARTAKARALECFSSQTHPAGQVPIIGSHVLEYFSRPYESFLI